MRQKDVVLAGLLSWRRNGSTITARSKLVLREPDNGLLLRLLFLASCLLTLPLPLKTAVRYQSTNCLTTEMRQASMEIFMPSWSFLEDDELNDTRTISPPLTLFVAKLKEAIPAAAACASLSLKIIEPLEKKAFLEVNKILVPNNFFPCCLPDHLVRLKTSEAD